MNLSEHLVFQTKFAPLYPANGRLFTHVPMALTALARMGASETRMDAFAAQASAKLVLKTACEPLLASEWREHLGQARLYAGYEVFFTQWLREEGVNAVLHMALPVLLPGVATAAFHPFIRLAYALQSRHLVEIAAALASWAACYETLELDVEKVRLKPGSHASFAQAIDIASSDKTLAMPSTRHSYIIDRMKAASELQGFASLLQVVRSTQPTLRDAAEASLAIYCDGNNFTALHMLTATHAARELSEQLPEFSCLIKQHLVPAWLAAWVSIESPQAQLKLAHQDSAVQVDWQTRLDCTVQSNDEHHIKLAYSAWCEAAHYGFAGYAAVVANVVSELAC